MKLLLAILVLCAADAMGASVRLAWDAAPGNSFKVYAWTEKGTNVLDVGNATFATVPVVPGVAYTFAATAYDAFSESEFSNLVTYTYPAAPSIILPNLTLTGGDSILEQSTNLVNWSPAVVVPTVAIVPMSNGRMFYRWRQGQSRIEIKQSL